MSALEPEAKRAVSIVVAGFVAGMGYLIWILITGL
jgi:hypothetical protein